MLSTREVIHRLVDQLPDSELLAAKRALERLAGRPSLAEFLANAPREDELISPREEAAAREAWADVAAGRVISDEEIDRAFGLDGLNSWWPPQFAGPIAPETTYAAYRPSR